MLEAPNPPQGSSAQANWLRRIRQHSIENRVLSGRGYRTRRTTAGIILDINPGKGGTGLGLFRFKSMQNDYLVCRSWNGTVEGTQDVYIAKPPKLRFSISTETIDGVVVAYSGYGPLTQTRNASGGGNSESQVIVPRYLVNDLIYAMPAPTLVTFVQGPKTIKVGLLDINADGRAWSAV
jgi:hypothetical protein